MDSRNDAIMQLLTAQRETTVKELAKKLYVSESTIRRDLAVLASQDLIVRTFRGARLKNITNAEKASIFYRSHQNTEKKKRIAEKCLPFLHDGDTVMMDDSSTVLFVVPLLSRFHNLTVITNSVRTSYALCENDIPNYVLGGNIGVCKSLACTGPYAENMLKQFHGDVALFSCKGLSSTGMISSGSESQDELRRIMIENCRTRVLMCDSTKIGKIYLHEYGSIREIDAVLCDEPLPPRLASMVGTDRRTETDEYKIRKH